MSFKKIINTTKAHYSKQVETHGTNYKGVDWGSDQGQKIRFEQILKFINLKDAGSIIDYGCGYGALLDALVQRGFKGRYQGYDISDIMISKALEKYGSTDPNTVFTSDDKNLGQADFTVTSGIFNVKLNTPDDQWTPYILHTLEKIAGVSRKGIIFNMLSAYTPPHAREADLYYADPGDIFKFCMKRFSTSVSLSHDYPLNDFTVFVRLVPDN